MDSTNSNDTRPGAEAEASRPQQTVGELLRAARLDRGLDIEDVARQLRLSVKQITALEEDDYGKFPSATFLRGFIRNYAKLLQVDAMPLLQLLQQSLPSPSAPTISYQIEGIPFPSNHKQGKRGLIVAVVIILALLLLIFEIYNGNESNKEREPAVKMETETEAEQAAAQPESELPPAFPAKDTADPVSSADLAPSAEDARIVQSKPETPLPVPSPARQVTAAVGSPESENAAIPEPADGRDTLHLVFGGESWVEIKDSRGKLLLSRINPRGTEQVLHGKAPFSLAIGNAAQVKLVYNDKPVDLAPYVNAYGGTARLSLK